MTKEQVFEKLKEILVEEFELEAPSITLGARMFEELGLDSIDAVDLIIKMRPYLPGKLDPEMFKKARTVEDVVDVLLPLTERK
jgi:acyl carrier protein